MWHERGGVMEPGIYRNISNADYHAGPGLNSSGLKLLRRTPKHFRKTEREETNAMVLGTATHCAVLEPERFEAEYVRNIDGDGRTKEVKEARAALTSSGKTVLDASDFDEVRGMAEAVLTHPTAGNLFRNGLEEVSVYWNYSVVVDDTEETILCKCRPDYIIPTGQGRHLIIDLKTTKDAGNYAFGSDAWKLGYHIQAAHYMRGMTAEGLCPVGFVFVAVESKKPYCVSVYEATQEFLTPGYEETTRLYELYARCAKYNDWPGYPEEIQKLVPPRWAA